MGLIVAQRAGDRIPISGDRIALPNPSNEGIRPSNEGTGDRAPAAPAYV
jgi:hypothetical protein